MVYEIGQAHKMRKININCFDNTTYLSSAHSNPSYSYKRLNENTDSNTTVVLPQSVDISIQTQHNSASNSSAGANDVA